MCGNPPGTPASRKAATVAAANPAPPPTLIDTGDAEKRARASSRKRKGLAATMLTSPSGVLGSPLTVSAQAGGR